MTVEQLQTLCNALRQLGEDLDEYTGNAEPSQSGDNVPPPEFEPIIAREHYIWFTVDGKVQPAYEPQLGRAILPEPGRSLWKTLLRTSRAEVEEGDRSAIKSAAEAFRAWTLQEHDKTYALLPLSSEKRQGTRQNSNDNRDKFCYEKLKAGKTLAWIKSHIGKNSSWDSVETEAGISAAAKRYSQRKNLPWPLR